MFEKAKEFLFAEDRGVSPVIGVILMVAITVILAAVIATFVMNMGPSEATQPSVQWEWNNDGTNVTLSHTGGDAATPSNIKIQDNSSNTAYLDDWGHLGEEMTAGDSVMFNGTATGPYNPPDPMNNSFQLIWENPNSDQTQVISDYEP